MTIVEINGKEITMNQKDVDKIDKKVLSDYVIPIVVSVFTTIIILILLLPNLLTR